MGNTLCFSSDNYVSDQDKRKQDLEKNTYPQLIQISTSSSDQPSHIILENHSKKLTCPFCLNIIDSLQTTKYSNEFKDCSSEENQLYILDLLNTKNHVFSGHPCLEQDILKIESVESLYRLKFPVLIKDDIIQITTSWFQLNLLQPKMIMELDDYQENSKEYQLIQQFEILQHTQLNNVEQAVLIALRWVLIENFCPQIYNEIFQQQIENSLLKEAYQLYQQIYHFCIALKIQFEELCYQQKQIKQYDMLYIYVTLWNKYQEFMQTIIQQWELLADGIQNAYRIHFDQQDDKIPHFKFHGIMARFWCQIILNDNQIQQILKSSYQKLLEYIVVEDLDYKMTQQQQSKKLFSTEDHILEVMRIFVNSIIDVSIQEASIHVIGHPKYKKINEIFSQFCEISDSLINYRLYDEKGFGLESYYRSSIIVNKLQSIYPSWYFDEFQERCYEKLRQIKNKILMKPKLKHEIKIDNSTEFINEKKSQIGKKISTDTQNTASTNILQFSDNSNTFSTNFSQKISISDTQKGTTASEFNTLLSDSQDTVLQSQQIIHPDLSEIIDGIEKNREKVRTNKDRREKIIESRCRYYKIRIDRDLDFLNFFKSRDLTSLNKLSPKMKDGMKILIEQRIKKIQIKQNLTHKEIVQLEEFKELLKK